MAGNYTIQIDRFIKKVKGKNIPEAIQGAALHLLGGVVDDTPVDTGLLRANWRITVGAPDLSEDSPADPSKNYTKSNLPGKNKIASALKLFITNNVEYAEAVENGSSKIAPALMLEKNVSRFNQFIKDFKGR